MINSLKYFLIKNKVLSLALAYSALVLPFLGSAHLFDWDEINFAEAAREMIVSGDWLNVQINHEPFWEKPPFFLWLQALSMLIFGVGEFAARFPNFVAGLLTLVFLYKVLRKHISESAAWYAVVMYMAAITPHFYFKSGIIDPWYNFFMFCSLYGLYRAAEQKINKFFFLSGLFLGLAILTKGPAALLLVGLTGLVFQLRYRQNFYDLKSLVVLVLGILLIPGIWFGIQTAVNGFWFLREFLAYQVDLFLHPVASHGQPFYYHIIVLLIGCFPLTIIALPAIFAKRTTLAHPFVQWNVILFWVVLIVFSAVTTKIVHYSSMCYLPLAVLASDWLAKRKKILFWQKIAIAAIGVLWVSALLFLPMIINIDSLKSFLFSKIADDFTLAQLSTVVSWPWFVYLLPLLFAVGLLFILYSKRLTPLSFLPMIAALFFMIIWIVPRVEKHTQYSWIVHLTKYQDKEMVHLTRGFKSYAHVFYTKQQKFVAYEQLKLKALEKMGLKTFLELSQDKKGEYESHLRDLLVHHSDVPFSLSSKIAHKEELQGDSALVLVFEGNGYCVWERKTSLQ